MNEIDFLPDSFVREQSRQKRIVREVTMIIVVSALIGLWYISSRGTLSTQAAYADSLQGEVSMAKIQVGEMERLQKERTQLVRELQIQRDLALPLGYTQVVATIGQMMPESVALTELTLASKRPTPAGTGGPGEPARRRAVGKDNKDNLLHIQLTGLSANELDIANFVGKLSEHALFTNVKMVSSKTVIVSDVQAREFHMELDVRLDCEYKPVSPVNTNKTQGVQGAH